MSSFYLYTCTRTYEHILSWLLERLSERSTEKDPSQGGTDTSLFSETSNVRKVALRRSKSTGICTIHLEKYEQYEVYVGAYVP